MAGSPEPEPKPDLGIGATVVGLFFVVAVLTGFGVATASGLDGTDYEDGYESDYEDGYESDYEDE